MLSLLSYSYSLRDSPVTRTGEEVNSPFHWCITSLWGKGKSFPSFHSLGVGYSRILRQACSLLIVLGNQPMPVTCTLFTCSGLNWPTGLSRSDGDASSVHTVGLGTAADSLVPKCWSIPMLLCLAALLPSHLFAELCWATPHWHQCKAKKKLELSVRFSVHLWHFPPLHSAFHISGPIWGEKEERKCFSGLANGSFQQTPSHQHCNLQKISCNKDRLFIFLWAQSGSPRVSRGYL